MDYKDKLLERKGKYKKELLESVLPFWEQNCVDHQEGGYFTFLDRDGSVYDTDKYMWMQWRIVYMFAVLYASYEKRSSWLEIAENGARFLLKNGKAENGRYYFALNRRGIPTVAPYNIFSDCFAVMGNAALYRATGREGYKREAEESMNIYISSLENPKGKWNKIMEGASQFENLGHYMILANLGTVMEEEVGTNRFQSETTASIEKVLDRFWDPSRGILFEYVLPGGKKDISSCIGRHTIPGHGLEALWFILSFAERYNRQDLIDKALPMIPRIFQFAWDTKYGGLYYFMDVLGKPKVELEWDMKLWWVHNEAAIAALYGYLLSGEKKYADWFFTVEEWTWEHFPDTRYGEWYGYLNRLGDPTHRLKGGKWKTFFHLPRYLYKVEQLLERIR
jgi:N-acylglucosamine 2-epimerase